MGQYTLCLIPLGSTENDFSLKTKLPQACPTSGPHTPTPGSTIYLQYILLLYTLTIYSNRGEILLYIYISKKRSWKELLPRNPRTGKISFTIATNYFVFPATEFRSLLPKPKRKKNTTPLCLSLSLYEVVENQTTTRGLSFCVCVASLLDIHPLKDKLKKKYL